MSKPYSIRGALTISTATQQLADCFTALNEGLDVFDFSELHDLDSTALALIMICQREAGRLGKALRCINLPENLKNLAALYGVENYIPA